MSKWEFTGPGLLLSKSWSFRAGSDLERPSHLIPSFYTGNTQKPGFKKLVQTYSQREGQDWNCGTIHIF